MEYPWTLSFFPGCRALSFPAMNKLNLFLIALLTGTLTFALYTYKTSRPPDQEQIERCNEEVAQMPENTQEEINRSINTFIECLEE
jgi:hypothetical protein